MSYLESCLSDHIQGMKNRLHKMKRKRDLLNEGCQVLEEEIAELQLGFENWKQEAEKQGHDDE